MRRTSSKDWSGSLEHDVIGDVKKQTDEATVVVWDAAGLEEITVVVWDASGFWVRLLSIMQGVK